MSWETCCRLLPNEATKSTEKGDFMSFWLHVIYIVVYKHEERQGLFLQLTYTDPSMPLVVVTCS